MLDSTKFEMTPTRTSEITKWILHIIIINDNNASFARYKLLTAHSSFRITTILKRRLLKLCCMINEDAELRQVY